MVLDGPVIWAVVNGMGKHIEELSPYEVGVQAKVWIVTSYSAFTLPVTNVWRAGDLLRGRNPMATSQCVCQTVHTLAVHPGFHNENFQDMGILPYGSCNLLLRFLPASLHDELSSCLPTLVPSTWRKVSRHEQE